MKQCFNWRVLQVFWSTHIPDVICETLSEEIIYHVVARSISVAHLIWLFKLLYHINVWVPEFLIVCCFNSNLRSSPFILWIELSDNPLLKSNTIIVRCLIFLRGLRHTNIENIVKLDNRRWQLRIPGKLLDFNP